MKDPDGKITDAKRKEALTEDQKSYENILDGVDVNEQDWTSSLDGVPTITHSLVEQFFHKSEGKRHLMQGYAFSKTQKFETSGKPLQINLLKNHANMFLIRGFTRPAMKQAKGDELYKICVLFDKTTGEILSGKDYSCAAGKRGYCKHVAALAYKLAEVTMSSMKHLPKPISCTEIKQKWGLPSIKSQQDPEKELMKRKPLQEIVFEKHVASRDEMGGRKRKLPVEVSAGYSSRPSGEPPVDDERVAKLCEDLADTKCPKAVIHVLQSHLTDNDTEEARGKENEQPEQRTLEWFHERVGKITSSKAPAVIGILGRKEYIEIWDCIKKKQQEPKKKFKFFSRGLQYESDAADCFVKDSGAQVKSCGFYSLNSDKNYGASPDRLFQGESCKNLLEIKTGNNHILSGLCILEIKTRAEGCPEPLSSVTGCHMAQVQLQLHCTGANTGLLQSYVPEIKRAKYFLMSKNVDFIYNFMNSCNAVLSNQIIESTGKVPDFDTLLFLRQQANRLAKLCMEVVFV